MLELLVSFFFFFAGVRDESITFTIEGRKTTLKSGLNLVIFILFYLLLFFLTLFFFLKPFSFVLFSRLLFNVHSVVGSFTAFFKLWICSMFQNTSECYLLLLLMPIQSFMDAEIWTFSIDMRLFSRHLLNYQIACLLFFHFYLLHFIFRIFLLVY